MATLGLGVLAIAAGMFVPMVLAPALGHHQWWTPSDGWRSLRAAHYVSQGSYPLVYETGSFHDVFDAGPLYPLALAPVALIGDIFHLRENYPIPRRHPGMWYLFGPYALASVFPLLYGIRALATQCRMRANKTVLQFLLLVLAFAPMAIVYGHYEDVVALALLFLAFRDLFGAREARGALLIAVAIAFKQWSLLAVPIYVTACVPALRPRVAVRCVLPPAVLMGAFIAADYKYASSALLHPPAYPLFGHSALWIPAGTVILRDVPTRAGAFVIAFAAAWLVRKRPDPASVMTALGVALFARIFFEPVLHAYYLAPGVACVLIAAMLRGRRVVTNVTVSAVLLVLFPFHVERVLWWAGLYALSALLLYDPLRFLVRPAVRVDHASAAPAYARV